MNITLISPYHGGSHKAWANGLQTHSQHQVHLLTLPARFWKWRMHGAAVTLARRFNQSDIRPDVLLATDMLDLTTFLALTRKAAAHIPALLYMHENQLTYPLPEDKTTGPMRRQLGERDRHYAFINYASMMAADRVFFNSTYHFNVFFERLPKFLNHFPEYKEMGSVRILKNKSEILPVGVDLRRLQWAKGSVSPNKGVSPQPIILWNQRWEYDKNPEDFFSALKILSAEDMPFKLVLCGQQYGKWPPAFEKGIEQLSDKIIHMGYAPTKQYKQLLWQSDIVISTAFHEFFGISILEAIFAHTFPILPNRLSYPELIPQDMRPLVLYNSQEELLERLRWAITHAPARREMAQSLAEYAAGFDWRQMAPIYDQRIALAAT